MTNRSVTDSEHLSAVSPATRRLFFALWPDEATREQLAHITRKAVRGSGGRPIPVENLHSTLVFLGSVPEIASRRSPRRPLSCATHPSSSRSTAWSTGPSPGCSASPAAARPSPHLSWRRLSRSCCWGKGLRQIRSPIDRISPSLARWSSRTSSGPHIRSSGSSTRSPSSTP